MCVLWSFPQWEATQRIIARLSRSVSPSAPQPTGAYQTLVTTDQHVNSPGSGFISLSVETPSLTLVRLGEDPPSLSGLNPTAPGIDNSSPIQNNPLLLEQQSPGSNIGSPPRLGREDPTHVEAFLGSRCVSYKNNSQLRGVGLTTTSSQADYVSAAGGKGGSSQEGSPARGPECPKVALSPGSNSHQIRALEGLDQGMAHVKGHLAAPSSGSAKAISALLGSTIFPGDSRPWSALVESAGSPGSPPSQASAKHHSGRVGGAH